MITVDPIDALSDAFSRLESARTRAATLTQDLGRAQQRVADVEQSLRECREDLAQAAAEIKRAMAGDPLRLLCDEKSAI